MVPGRSLEGDTVILEIIGYVWAFGILAALVAGIIGPVIIALLRGSQDD